MYFIICILDELLGGVPEWPKGADCKSAVADFDGSNPSPSTTYCNIAYFTSCFLFSLKVILQDSQGPVPGIIVPGGCFLLHDYGFHLKIKPLYMTKFQHTIIPVATSFATGGAIFSTPENNIISPFEIKRFMMKRTPYIMNCLYKLPWDLKDHALFKKKLMINPSVMATELDHTYHNSRIRCSI